MPMMKCLYYSLYKDSIWQECYFSFLLYPETYVLFKVKSLQRNAYTELEIFVNEFENTYSIFCQFLFAYQN